MDRDSAMIVMVDLLEGLSDDLLEDYLKSTDEKYFKAEIRKYEIPQDVMNSLLKKANLNGNKKVAEFLESLGAKDQDKLDALLIKSYADRDTKEVNKLLEQGANREIYDYINDYTYESPFIGDPFIAVGKYKDNPYLVDVLLDGGYRPLTHHTFTDLVRQGRTDVLRKLVEIKFYDEKALTFYWPLFEANIQQNKEAFNLLVKLGADPENPEYLGKLKQMPQYKFSFQQMLFNDPTIPQSEIYNDIRHLKIGGKLSTYLESIGLSSYINKDIEEVAKAIKSLLDWNSEDIFELFRDVVNRPDKEEAMDELLLELIKKKNLKGLDDVRKYVGYDKVLKYNLSDLLDYYAKALKSESEIVAFLYEWMGDLEL